MQATLWLLFISFINELPMKHNTPGRRSKQVLGATRARAKTFEFSVPGQTDAGEQVDSSTLFPLTISIIGDLASAVARGDGATRPLDMAKADLRFSAYFFDAFIQASPQSLEKNYLCLLASAGYYLCDLPGSAFVISKAISNRKVARKNAALEDTLLWILQGDFERRPFLRDTNYSAIINNATEGISVFYRKGGDAKAILSILQKLRKTAYALGDARDLILSDLIYAVTSRRLEISARTCLPKYTSLPVAVWETALAKTTFIREFWPAQRLLGEQGVFRGRSAVVQMPTSAGKTRATEVLIRSAFYSTRTKLAVLVAPFRALCHEIRGSLKGAFRGENVRIDEISDVHQDDFFFEAEDIPHIYVLTPEKLLYILRQTPDLADRIGLLIYDEGHQFDEDKRGVTYELLLTSLNNAVPDACQIVLISAVIKNATEISEWLNGAEGSVIAGTDLLPNSRSIAFATWIDGLGGLHFLEQTDSDDPFDVPQILESHKLIRLNKERTDRYFPIKDDARAIALYLGLRLVPKGAVAVFCGKKNHVTSACEQLVDAFERKLPQRIPLEHSDRGEVAKLLYLVQSHFGEDSGVTRAAALGVFTHHGNTPTGVRLAVEHAMRESFIKMVVCTSTLAQGVNIPIKYLIVSEIMQGEELISVRDFQNLMGRVGRSGMHTEGSVIFANPAIYDERVTNNYWWKKVSVLLDPQNSADCASTLKTLLNPIKSAQNDDSVELNVSEFFQHYIAGHDGLKRYSDLLSSSRRMKMRGYTPEDIHSQLLQKAEILRALESFVMADTAGDLSQENAISIARDTLAYYLSSPAQKAQLEEIFALISRHTESHVPEPPTRRAYAKNLFGVADSIEIHEWAKANLDSIAQLATGEELLRATWPLFKKFVTSSTFRKCTKQDLLVDVALMWIDDIPEYKIFNYLTQKGVRFGMGVRPFYATIDHVMELCENVLAYEGTLVIAALIESIRLESLKNEALIDRLEILQKRLKYGVSSRSAILLHEMGLMDRVLANELVDIAGRNFKSRDRLVSGLKEHAEETEACLKRFPSYYTYIWQLASR